jgi:hypothetical protein
MRGAQKLGRNTAPGREGVVLRNTEMAWMTGAYRSATLLLPPALPLLAVGSLPVLVLLLPAGAVLFLLPVLPEVLPPADVVLLLLPVRLLPAGVVLFLPLVLFPCEPATARLGVRQLVSQDTQGHACQLPMPKN